MKYLYPLFLFLLSISTTYAQYPKEVTYALEKAGNNREGLENLLDHYQKENKEKYKGACFLISNMIWNRQYYHITQSAPLLATKLNRADSSYYSIVKELSDTALYNERFNRQVLAKADQVYRKMMEASDFASPVIEAKEIMDISHINADFLRRQIEHSFKLRDNSPFVKPLKFEEFLEYVLPYRATDLSAAESADVYAHLYNKYLHTDTTTTARNLVWRYNVTADRLRYWGGKYPFDHPIGRDEMFFLGWHDCASIADYGTMILRACGLPAALEYNIAYKFWNGQHYHVSTPINGKWHTFSPESSLPLYRDSKFYEALNIFRLHFSRQTNNPYSLKASQEIIPDILADPRIEDVSHETGNTVKLSLPFNISTSNNLAYLGTFLSQEMGLRPVTWGVINKQTGTALFEHVVPDNLYFPVYLDENGDYHSFGEPFVVIEDKGQNNGYRLEHIKVTGTPTKARIERKFPRKPHLLQIARKIPGTYVLGADNPDFHNADTLGIIRNVPGTAWEDIELSTDRPYLYYRICGTGNPARVYLSEINFLTKRQYAYTNTMEAPQTHLLSAEENAQWVRLLDEPLEKCRWKAEYDNNPQTAPDKWPDVTLMLKEPQYVHRIRYMAKHADNAVKSGAKYEIREWADGFWKKTATNIVSSNGIIEADNLKPGQLYWLRLKGEGKEELPFFIDDKGTQHFPHLPFLEKNSFLKR